MKPQTTISRADIVAKMRTAGVPLTTERRRNPSQTDLLGQIENINGAFEQGLEEIIEAERHMEQFIDLLNIFGVSTSDEIKNYVESIMKSLGSANSELSFGHAEAENLEATIMSEYDAVEPVCSFDWCRGEYESEILEFYQDHFYESASESVWEDASESLSKRKDELMKVMDDWVSRLNAEGAVDGTQVAAEIEEYADDIPGWDAWD